MAFQSFIPNDIRQTLANTPVELLTKHIDVLITANTTGVLPNSDIKCFTDTIADALKKLTDHNIWSVPLYDQNARRYIAFIDVFDILAYIIDALNLTDHDSWRKLGTGTSPSSFGVANLTNEIGDEFSLFTHAKMQEPCSSLIHRTPRNTWFAVAKDVSLQAVINIMAQNNLRRVGVHDENGKFTSVLTQSAITRFIANLVSPISAVPHELGNEPVQITKEFEQLTMDKIPMLHHDVISIHHKAMALEAFLLIHRKQVSGIGLLDDDGKLVGNVSGSDIKRIGLTGQNIKRLREPIDVFLDRKDSTHVYVVGENDTLVEALQIMRETHVHRVYIVDPATQKPTGILSQTDVMKLFSSRNIL